MYTTFAKKTIPEGREPDIPDSIRIIRSDRRTLSLQVRPGGEILVRAPRHATLQEIRAFVLKNRAWLQKHIALVQEETARTEPADLLTMEEIRRLAEEAMRVIPGRVAHFAPLVGVRYGRITIRNQKTRWGSCSGKGNLNFNCLLMLAPVSVQTYVVVHELCHRREMNHSDRFWKEVERIMPDYRIPKKWLKDNGSALIARLPE